MLDTLTEIEQLLIMYAPVILSITATVVNFVKTFRSIKTIDVDHTKSLSAVNDKLDVTTADLKAEIAELRAERDEYAKLVKESNKAVLEAKESLTTQLTECRAEMNTLAQKNIELEAKWRDKHDKLRKKQD